ncbi:MAG: SEC-C metal-binding domain-containing protein [Steroidobacteraceae bacterium]
MRHGEVPKTRCAGGNRPCGSGQKYKRCCLAKDQLAESAALAAASAARATDAAHHNHSHQGCDFCGNVIDDTEDELTRDSNAVVDLVHEGKLDQAEAAARELLERYPEVHDGYDRLGMVYEARGDKKQAADCHRKVIEFVRHHPDQYEPGFEETFQGWVEELDPPVAT